MTSDEIEPDEPTWRKPRRWPFVLLGLAVLIVLTLAWAGTYANAVWFRSVGYGDVYGTLAVTRSGLFVTSAVITAVTMVSSILVASLRRPAESDGGTWSERYRAYAEPLRLWIWIGLVLIAALAMGAAETARWRDLLLWWQGGSFGTEDPWFHHDIGFYVFTVPWLHDLADFGLTMGLLAIATAVAAHYFYGGITISPRVSWTRAAQRHVAVLIGITLIFKAGDYWLARYDTVHAGGPWATGVAYVDQHGSIPGREVLTYAALFCAGLFLWQMRRPRWRMPVVSLTLLFVSSITLSLIWPAILQGTVVRPNPMSHERQNLTDSIAATRVAYGLDKVTTTPLSGGANAAADLPLLDPARVRTQARTEQGATDPSEPELDRYVVDGQQRAVLVSMGQRGSVGEFLAAYADARDRAGKPRVLLTWAQGGGTHDLGTGLDAPLHFGPDRPQNAVDSGAPGVPLTFLNRFAYALAGGNLGLLGQHGSIAVRVDPLTRAGQIAPWLQLDQHPYLTTSGGRPLWVIDGYTTTGAYPGSEVGSWATMTGDGSPTPSAAYDTVNYLRNAVKVTVDAQDGTVKLYEWDADPILRAWEGIFPGLVHSRAEIPPDLVPHLRYPTDLFAAQRYQAQTWVSATPETLLAGRRSLIPANGDSSTWAPLQRTFVNGVWSVLAPMSASNGHDLAGVLIANSDATSSEYGQLRWLMPAAATGGPPTVNAIMRADPHVRDAIHGLLPSDTAQWGPLWIVPDARGPLWVAPLYGISSDASKAPALLGVVVAVGDAVGVGPTLPQALEAAAAGAADRAPTAATLVRDANALLARADDETLTQQERATLLKDARAKLDAAYAVLRESK